MYASAGILIFGHDAILLETRQLILKKAGFQVWIASEATKAVQILVTEPIDLFIPVSVAASSRVCIRFEDGAYTAARYGKSCPGRGSTG